MTPTHNLPTPSTPLCQVCQKRPGKGRYGQLLVCEDCYDEAKDEEIRLYRFSLKVVQGGCPR